MKLEKRVGILVGVAIVLAIVAISLNSVQNSHDVRTINQNIGETAQGGEIAINILPPTVEDKGTSLNTNTQK